MSETEPRRPLSANGEPPSQDMARYVLVVYDAESMAAYECRSFDELLGRIDPQRINWVTIRDVHDEAEIARLLEVFHVDPFVLVEILDEGRMQFDMEYDNCLYLEYTVPYLHPERKLLEQSLSLIHISEPTRPY